MEIQEVADTLGLFMKLFSGCFAIIVGLLIYIWKTDKTRNEKMFNRINKTLEELTILTTRHDVKIENLKQ